MSYTWNNFSNDNSSVQICVDVDSAGKKLFASSEGLNGTGYAAAPWIQPNKTYLFTLFDYSKQSPDCTGTVLSSCQLKGVLKTPTGVIKADPNPCVVPQGQSICTANLTYSYNAPSAIVCVQQNNDPITVFASNASGSTETADWIHVNNRYIFTLRSPAKDSSGNNFCGGTILNSVTVTAK